MRISLYIVCWLVEYLTATVHLSVCSKPCVHILSLIRPELQMKVCENSFLSQWAAKYLLFQAVGSNRWNFSSRPPCSMCRGAVGVLSACLFKIQIIILILLPNWYQTLIWLKTRNPSAVCLHALPFAFIDPHFIYFSFSRFPLHFVSHSFILSHALVAC